MTNFITSLPFMDRYHAFWLFFLLFLPTSLLAVNEDLAPESATEVLIQPAAPPAKSMVVTAHPLATQAGFNILQQGGSAADAAVAIQAMLTLVEPQSSGIGGGAFLLYWDQKQKLLHAYDGRETAPASADSDLFLDEEGKPISWYQALVGGRSVGTPGVLHMLAEQHRTFGKLAWKSLFKDAITQAHDGFKVTPRLHNLIASEINPGLTQLSPAKEYFFNKDGEPLAVGSLLKNPQLAVTLTNIAEHGTDYFYQGSLAAGIATAVETAPVAGLLTISDLKQYRSVKRKPLCLPYLSYTVCGFPPPTSGGVTLLQILKLLEGFPLQQLAPDSIEFNHLFTQASRLAYADRARYLADADFVPVPVAQLLSPGYLAQRRALITNDKDMGHAKPGKVDNQVLADDRSPELPSTSHFVVVDRWGDAVSSTSSIEMAFGSSVMTHGFLLNNQLTDFSFVAQKDGQLIANRVEAGKRPRSSMSPVMIFDEKGELYAMTGSPGGSRIINYVAQNILIMLNSNLSLQQVVDMPHISNRNGVTELEQDTVMTELEELLLSKGHNIKIRDLNSGIHAIRKLGNGLWESGVDKRREGLALGE